MSRKKRIERRREAEPVVTESGDRQFGNGLRPLRGTRKPQSHGAASNAGFCLVTGNGDLSVCYVHVASAIGDELQ